MDADGNRVNVGNSADGGVNVNNYWDDNRNDNLGVASARKFPKSYEEMLSFLGEHFKCSFGECFEVA